MPEAAASPDTGGGMDRQGGGAGQCRAGERDEEVVGLARGRRPATRQRGRGRRIRLLRRAPRAPVLAHLRVRRGEPQRCRGVRAPEPSRRRPRQARRRRRDRRARRARAASPRRGGSRRERNGHDLQTDRGRPAKTVKGQGGRRRETADEGGSAAVRLSPPCSCRLAGQPARPSRRWSRSWAASSISL